MSKWLDDYRKIKDEHDCSTCHSSDGCPLKPLIPRIDEMIQYVELHSTEYEEFMDSEEEFVDHALDILHKFGPIIDRDDIKGMFVILLLEGFVRGRQYVEVPDAYRK